MTASSQPKLEVRPPHLRLSRLEGLVRARLQQLLGLEGPRQRMRLGPCPAAGTCWAAPLPLLGHLFDPLSQGLPRRMQRQRTPPLPLPAQRQLS